MIRKCLPLVIIQIKKWFKLQDDMFVKIKKQINDGWFDSVLRRMIIQPSSSTICLGIDAYNNLWQ